jgi:hypothetical protein
MLLVVHADDFGRLEGDPFSIRMRVWPSSPRPDSEFADALRALDQAGLIHWYEVNDRKYVEVVSFAEHQTGLKNRTTSKFPERPDGQVAGAATVPGDSGNFLEVPEDSRKFPDIPSEEKGREGNGREGNDARAVRQQTAAQTTSPPDAAGPMGTAEGRTELGTPEEPARRAKPPVSAPAAPEPEPITVDWFAGEWCELSRRYPMIVRSGTLHRKDRDRLEKAITLWGRHSLTRDDVRDALTMAAESDYLTNRTPRTSEVILSVKWLTYGEHLLEVLAGDYGGNRSSFVEESASEIAARVMQLTARGTPIAEVIPGMKTHEEDYFEN